ncbi:DUF3971 domain-containing protein [Kamptonema cortianum]|nr:DUF3971 domain-containing protein [Kamptonema cortianum]
MNRVNFTPLLTMGKALFSKRPVRLLLYTIGSIFSLILLIIFLLLVRLSFSPINLDFLTPDIEANLNIPQVGIKGKISHTQLVWREWASPFEIELQNVYLQKDGNPSWLEIDHVGISLRLIRLMIGELSLKQVRFYDPYILLEKQEGGGFSLGLGKNKPEEDFSLEELLPFLALGGSNAALGKLYDLSKVSIINAHIQLSNPKENQTWQLPKTSFRLKRKNNGFEFSIKLAPHQGTGALILTLGHHLGSSRINTSLKFKNISIEKLFESKGIAICPLQTEITTLDDLLNFLQCWDLPLNGQINLTFKPETYEIIDAKGDLALGKGSVDLSVAKIFPLPLQSGNISFSLTPEAFLLKKISLISDSMKLNVTGEVKTKSPFFFTNFFEGVDNITLQGEMEDLHLDHIAALWPQDVATNAREWATKNLHAGLMTEAIFSLKGHKEETGFSIDELKGTLKGKDAEISYLEGMPPAQNVSVQGTFDKKSFDFNIFSGNVDYVEVEKGHVLISGLDTGEEALSLEIESEGSLSNILKIIDNKPLEYASYGGIDPKKVKGEGRINLKMNFPLINDLKFKDVKIAASGKFQKVALERQVTKTLKAQLAQGDLSFNLTQDKLEVKGKGVLNNLSSTLLYTHYFKSQTPNEIEIQVDTKASFDDFKRLGFDYTEYAQGPTNTQLTYHKTTGGQNKVAIDLDTTAADLVFQPLDWEKKPGEESHISFILFMENEKLSKINPIRFTSPTYSLLGEALFDNNGEWEQVHLSDLKGPFTDTQVNIQKLKQNSYEIGFKGRSVNLEKILKLLDDDTKKQKHPSIHLKLLADVGTLRVGEDKIFNRIDGFANLFIKDNDTYWKEVHFTAQAGQGTANKGQMSQVSGGISFDLHAPQGGIQTLEVRANDAGIFLKNLDIYQGIRGGYITIKATRKNQGPFSGVFKMKDFDALEVPLLAQFAALLSPMGIANLLSGGHTLSMESFGCSFEFGEESVKIQKGIGKSMSLGFTVDGNLDRKKRLFSLKGNVIPARFLNSILSNIPIIGPLLNGGEGQGMFAISYTVTGSFDNPEISLNPLTALAPGFIRNLFTFDD